MSERITVEMVASLKEATRAAQKLEKTLRLMRLNTDVRLLSDEEWQTFKGNEDGRRS